ncbi:MAG: lysyl-tRNA synthetase [Microgenomates group bacterium Gr01-1014_16]|nr:MAG: lysyl-tRNA synthetase [Microgenomates group bacterium Gr01-1014_16]
MSSSRLAEIRQNRIAKLAQIKKLGIDPYPAKSLRDTQIGDILSDYSGYHNKRVVVAGRVLAMRIHGQIAFLDLKDASGKIQVLLKDEHYLSFIDSSDFIEVSGNVMKTQSGEVTVESISLRLLAKALRPLPDQWDGLKDKETRLRRRYLDTNINPDVYSRFLRRSKFWEAHREFFKKKGFVEINIPVLEHIPGGGDANPFVTHMDAIDQDFYLRISQELYLKRLIGGGYEKVYEIGPRFRNEGLSDEHLPEHIAMEFYWAYADWQDGMQIIKDLFAHVIKSVYGDKALFKIRGFDVDFGKEWEIIDFGKLFKDKFNVDIYTASLKDIQPLVKEKVPNLPRAIDALWKQLRKDIAGPAFLINHPKYLSPLQKPSVDNPNIVERFQPIIAGSELGNGWSEVNDALDQLERFQKQQAMRDAGDAEAQWLDIDYVEMLEYGMPPTFGYGHSERVFWFLEDVTAREGVPFPQLRFELEETTKEIYGL